MQLLGFVREVARLCETQAAQPDMLEDAARLMGALVSGDEWLAPMFQQPDARYYQQYLLYCDPQDRFSLVSFVWGPGQKTPVHDHTVWGVIGMLRGSEIAQSYTWSAQGLAASGDPVVLHPGDVEVISPQSGDIHQVSNAHNDRVSISIHLYGGNIGRVRRSVFDAVSGEKKPFVSGYSNALVPNLWAS